MKIHLHVVESDPFGENSYIVWTDGEQRAIVVDPGFEPEPIIEFLEKNKLTLSAVLNTHGHVDHIAGNRAMKRFAPEVPLVIGVGDSPMLTDPFLNRSAVYGDALVSPPADRELVDGEVFTYAGIEFEARMIPGHTSGHMVFVIHHSTPKLVLGGDVLFAGSVGRTDFPGGNHESLIRGIHEKLWPLPDETKVLPGHGPVTTVGIEKLNNPFVGAAARY